PPVRRPREHPGVLQPARRAPVLRARARGGQAVPRPNGRPLKASRSISKEDAMSDFVFLFRGGKDDWASPAEMQADMQKWFAWMKDLREKGHFKAGDPLEKGGK